MEDEDFCESLSRETMLEIASPVLQEFEKLLREQMNELV